MISRFMALLAAIALLAAGVQPVSAQGRHGGGGGGRGGGGMFHGGGGPPRGGGRGPGFGGGSGPGRGYFPGGGWRGGPGAYPGGYPGPGGRWPDEPPPPYRGPRAPNSLDQQGWGAQQDEVRRAVREGRHIPLSQAIATVRSRAPGRELDAGLEPGPNGHAVYRLRWAGQNGRRTDYLVDAVTGRIIGAVGGP
ncbi:PepSY domain-containing protein [Caulobacter sp. S45]|uniref:PepSY domain-containing protein n=1 Tax=Caulobacter sp. S45 TaxID=1641861 RepID=UPI00131AF5CE|nr:PepSY domain-containing protein [Caulobacter sp. S45]